MTNKLLAVVQQEADKINLKTGAFTSIEGLTLPVLISTLIRLVVIVAAVIFFFILVIGGIKWIASGGDKAQTESARNQITAALVGLVIVFSAWAIMALVKTFFGVDPFALVIPSVITQ